MKLKTLVAIFTATTGIAYLFVFLRSSISIQKHLNAHY